MASLFGPPCRQTSSAADDFVTYSPAVATSVERPTGRREVKISWCNNGSDRLYRCRRTNPCNGAHIFPHFIPPFYSEMAAHMPPTKKCPFCGGSGPHVIHNFWANANLFLKLHLDWFCRFPEIMVAINRQTTPLCL